MGAHGVARVIVDQLQDDARTSAGQNVFGAVELPARIRCGIDEPPPRRAGLLFRFTPGYSGIAEDAGQRCCRGACAMPIDRILSCTLIGPWSRPDLSKAARTATACDLTSSLSADGLDFGRRVRGSRAAAGPSTLARLRSS